MKKILEDQCRQLPVDRRWLLFGLTGVIIAFTAGASFHASIAPWLISDDELLHLDYAGRVYSGELPEFFDGVTTPIERPASPLPPVQWVYQHPPLFFLILAPFSGPALASGNWELATAIGRAINIALGLLAILAIAWATWVVGGRQRTQLVLATTVIASSVTIFVGVSAAIYSDTLVVLFVTLALGLSVRLLQRGPQKRYVILLIIVCLAGMASRLSFLPTLGLAGLALIGATWLHGQASIWRRLAKGGIWAAVMLLVVVAGTGWFYLRNFELSGQISGGQTAWAQANWSRRPTSYPALLANPELWLNFPIQIFGKPYFLIGGLPLFTYASLAIGALGSSAAINKLWRGFRRHSFDKTGIIIMALLASQIILTFATQLYHAAGGGMLIERYYLPALFPIAFILAVGALGWPRLRGMGVVAVVIIGWAAIVVKMFDDANKYIGSGEPWYNLMASAERFNGLPGWLPLVCLAVLTIGIAIQAIAMWRLTKDRLYSA